MDGELQGIRWGRAIVASIVLEVLLSLIAVPAFMLASDPATLLNILIPPASFVVAALVVIWLFRRAARPIANGFATGFASIAIYVLLGVVAYLVAPDRMDWSQSLGVPYLAAHALKVLGGGAGGWWLARKRAAAD